MRTRGQISPQVSVNDILRARPGRVGGQGAVVAHSLGVRYRELEEQSRDLEG